LFERIFFNAVSSAIGFIMRMSIILFYVLLQTLYVILLPFIIIAFFLSLPAYAIRYQYEKTPEEQRAGGRKRLWIPIFSRRKTKAPLRHGLCPTMTNTLSRKSGGSWKTSSRTRRSAATGPWAILPA
jgi:hypothetical protein